MKYLTKKEAHQLCCGLDYALESVRSGSCPGICSGISLASHVSIITFEQVDYLELWVNRMIGNNVWIERYQYLNYPGVYPPPKTFEDRYERRKGWVKWMKQHLMETSK